ncbi:hypothetical protein M0R45_008324 [Rubus argutus]|uniref:Uncharacterized protein n=1 Tax=Rubus argutus TaxID=59490 RepID=A0AAW1Y2D9_RUBAR
MQQSLGRGLVLQLRKLTTIAQRPNCYRCGALKNGLLAAAITRLLEAMDPDGVHRQDGKPGDWFCTRSVIHISDGEV